MLLRLDREEAAFVRWRLLGCEAPQAAKIVSQIEKEFPTLKPPPEPAFIADYQDLNA